MWSLTELLLRCQEHKSAGSGQSEISKPDLTFAVLTKMTPAGNRRGRRSCQFMKVLLLGFLLLGLRPVYGYSCESGTCPK